MPKPSAWGYGKWTRVDTGMYTSRAFLSLSGTAVKMLLLFLGKRKLIFPKDKKGGNGSMIVENWDQLTMTYEELANGPFHWTKPRISRSFDDLLAKGFIEVKDPGGLYKQHKAVYALSEAWKKWQPGMVIFRRCKDVHRGWQDAECRDRSLKN